MEQNYGSINAIFIQNSDKLLKTKQGKQVIREYINTIKRSDILKKEHLLYDYIESQEYSELTKDQISEAISYLGDVNKKQLKEEHLNLIKILRDNNISKITDIANENLYENVDKLIFTKKSLKTINEKVLLLNAIVENIKDNKKTLIEDKKVSNCEGKTIEDIVNNFNEEYMDTLTEDQIRIFESVNVFNVEEQKEKFNNIKKECLGLTNSFLKENLDIDYKETLLSVKEKLLEDKYNVETYVDDMIGYITLKETLKN